MQKAIHIENSSKNIVRVLSTAEPEIIENNPTEMEYILIEDFENPPESIPDNGIIPINYPMYDKINKQFKWIQIKFQHTATEEMLNIENIKQELVSVNGNINKLDKELFPIVDKTNLDGYKIYRIKESKKLLAEYLDNNPLLYLDNYYSVTQEKQTLLTSAISSYQLELQMGLTAILKWNTTGDICKEWTLEEIAPLVVAIKAFVQPRVEKQQALEIEINDCLTIEELELVDINYEII